MQRLVHFGREALERQPCPPFGLRFEIDDGLEHLGRRRIGRGRGAAGLAVHRLHFGKAPDDPVLHLQQFGCLGDGKSGQRGRHVEQRALVQIGHELGAELPGRPHRRGQNGERDQDHRYFGAHHRLDDRPIDPDQETVDRVLVLRNDLAAHEHHHQRRHQRHRQDRRRRHRKRLGEGERAEQATLLRLQREDRHE